MKASPQEIGTAPQWENVFHSVLRNPGIVLSLGEADSGKSTFLLWLCNRLLREGMRVAVVDADVGQSEIGPPTTVGVAIPHHQVRRFSDLSPLAFAFVGSISPSGHLLETLIASKKMVDRAARDGARVILVNTTGLVTGEAGISLKQGKIELLSPRHLVAFPRGQEMVPILSPYRHFTGVAIHLLSIHPQVRRKSPQERAAFRALRFKEYFSGGSVIDLSLENIAVSGAGAGVLDSCPRGTVGSLIDSLSEPISLCLFEQFHEASSIIRVFAAPPGGRRAFNLSEASVRRLHFGDLIIEREEL